MTDKVIIEEQLYEQALLLIKKNKETPAEVKKYLINNGVGEDTASEMIDEIIAINKKIKHRDAKRNVLIGLVILAVGLSITMMTPNRLPMLLVLAGIVVFVAGIIGTIDSK